MRRSKFELYVDILESIVIHGPLKVTWLILKAKANYAQLKPILDVLLEKRFVEKTTLRDGGVAFLATSSGRAVLSKFKQYDKTCIKPDVTVVRNQALENVIVR